MSRLSPPQPHHVWRRRRKRNQADRFKTTSEAAKPYHKEKST
jgi:hypothetical protein